MEILSLRTRIKGVAAEQILELDLQFLEYKTKVSDLKNDELFIMHSTFCSASLPLPQVQCFCFLSKESTLLK